MSRKPSLSGADERAFEGLAALEGIVKGERVEGLEIVSLPTTALSPSPYQPRRAFSKKALAELAESIKQEGVLQPILVRAVKRGKYEIVAGERRWRAAQMAGLDEVPCVVREVGEMQARVISLIENLHREDLRDMERGAAIRELHDITKASWDEVAKQIGLTRRSVLRLAGLANLPDDLQQLLIEKELTEKHGRALHKLGKKRRRQQELAEAIETHNLTGDEALRCAKYAEEHPRLSLKNVVAQVRGEGRGYSRGITAVMRAAEDLLEALKAARVKPMRETTQAELEMRLEAVAKEIANFQGRLNVLSPRVKVHIVGSE